jgi:uncharacterized protein YeaO (DUF488 family)
LAEDKISNQKRLYDHYAGMFPSFDIFKRVFTKITENYGIMVLTSKKGYNIEDKIFWYRVDVNDMHKKFSIGSKKFNEFHKKYYNSDWNNTKKLFNIDDYLNKRQKLNIDINLN